MMTTASNTRLIQAAPSRKLLRDDEDTLWPESKRDITPTMSTARTITMATQPTSASPTE